MILTIKEDYNKFEGTDLPMFSRTGKSTVSQYLQFSQGRKDHSFERVKIVEEEVGTEQDEDVDIMGDKSKDVSSELQRIVDEKKLRIMQDKIKKKNFGPGAQVLDPKSPNHGQVLKPIEFLKDLEFRRSVQPAFKSTTREQWEIVNASKTNSPEVGKYSPIYKQLVPSNRAVSIREEHQHIGQQRMANKEEQQTYVCLKQVKGLNYPVKHPKSQAERLAKVNKKILENEEHAQLVLQHANNPSWQDKEKIDTEEDLLDENPKKKEKLDMLNLFVKELRQPKYKEVIRKPQSPPQPCQHYNRFYLPNGKEVALKTAEEQQKGIKKLFIEDWKRVQYSYNAEFQGEVYHLVKDRGDTSFRIESNFRELIENDPAKNAAKTTKFSTKVPRKDKDYINSLNDSRFEIIDKSPSVLSQVTHVPGFNFDRHTTRPENLFGKSVTGGFYDTKKETVMKRLDAGIPDMRKLQSREQSRRDPLSVSCVDIEKVINAKTNIFKPKNPSLTNFVKSPARDEMMLKTDDRYFNLQLDKTREQRELQITQRSQRIKQYSNQTPKTK